jgi:ketosteroid isomerase-like protein
MRCGIDVLIPSRSGAKARDLAQRLPRFEVLEAVEAADHSALRDLLSPDVVWRVTGRSPLAGDNRGLDAVLS